MGIYRRLFILNSLFIFKTHQKEIFSEWEKLNDIIDVEADYIKCLKRRFYTETQSVVIFSFSESLMSNESFDSSQSGKNLHNREWIARYKARVISNRKQSELWRIICRLWKFNRTCKWVNSPFRGEIFPATKSWWGKSAAPSNRQSYFLKVRRWEKSEAGSWEKDKKLILFHLNGSRLVEQSLPWFIFSLFYYSSQSSWVLASLPSPRWVHFPLLEQAEHHSSRRWMEKNYFSSSFPFPLTALQSYFFWQSRRVGEASINFIHFLSNKYLDGMQSMKISNFRKNIHCCTRN